MCVDTLARTSYPLCIGWWNSRTRDKYVYMRWPSPALTRCKDSTLGRSLYRVFFLCQVRLSFLGCRRFHVGTLSQSQTPDSRPKELIRVFMGLLRGAQRVLINTEIPDRSETFIEHPVRHAHVNSKQRPTLLFVSVITFVYPSFAVMKPFLESLHPFKKNKISSNNHVAKRKLPEKAPCLVPDIKEYR